jgi:hypothetical protein
MCETCKREGSFEARADEYVAAGIAWLDQNGPADWRSRVDLGTLDINSVDDCVLGQVFRNHDRYRNGYYYAVETFLDDQFDDDITGPLGFSGVGEIGPRHMTEAWVRALSAE